MVLVRTIAASMLSVVVLAGLTSTSTLAKEPAPQSGQSARRETIQLNLRSNVHVEARVVQLGDIATITGGEARLREQLKRLDLEDTLLDGESVTITPAHVEFRLRVAGISLQNVSIRGSAVRVTSSSIAEPASIEVVSDVSSVPGIATLTSPEIESATSSDDGALERELIETAKRCIMRKLPWSAEDVDIRLSQPLAPEIRQIRSATGYDCQAELKNPGAAIGRVHLRVVAHAIQKPSFDFIAIFDVRHFDNIVLTTRPLERGHQIAASDIYTDRQDVTDLSEYCSRPSEMIGMTTKRALRPLTPLRPIDVEAANQASGSILIKRRDPVKLVGRLGAVSVIATGEALQEGRLGDVIRLRNTDSNSTVQGRVSGKGEVEIVF